MCLEQPAFEALLVLSELQQTPSPLRVERQLGPLSGRRVEHFKPRQPPEQDTSVLILIPNGVQAQVGVQVEVDLISRSTFAEGLEAIELFMSTELGLVVVDFTM